MRRAQGRSAAGRSATSPAARAILLALAACAALPALAGELLVEGPVLDVEPLLETRWHEARVGDCTPARPTRPDPVALLAWDLRVDCRTERRAEEVTTGYRVVYEWEGRRHTRVMDAPPGETVTLRVRLD